MATVVHLTDFHLWEDTRRVFEGVRAHQSCAKVVAAAAAAAPAPAAVLLTGDFSNDESCASYDHVRALVRAAWPAPTPVLYVPGNHEDVDVLEAAFRGDFEGPSGACEALATDLAPGWRALLLSSHVRGGHCAGALSAGALAAAAAELAGAQAAGLSVLLVLHHPPVEPCGAVPPWHDQCLRRPEALLALLQGSCCPLVLHGHLHADVATQVGPDCTALCSPSTCTQSLLDAPTWGRDFGHQPGFRLVSLLRDGRYDTRVVRVDCSDCEAEQ